MVVIVLVGRTDHSGYGYPSDLPRLCPHSLRPRQRHGRRRAKIAQPKRGDPAAPIAALTTPIEFYLAHGDANACGRGCCEWIAAEGKIDVGAADRFRQLLPKLGDRRPPIYFHSPGGKVNDALELGRIKKFEVSVGQTVPLGCGGDKQSASARPESAPGRPSKRKSRRQPTCAIRVASTLWPPEPSVACRRG